MTLIFKFLLVLFKSDHLIDIKHKVSKPAQSFVIYFSIQINLFTELKKNRQQHNTQRLTAGGRRDLHKNNASNQMSSGNFYLYVNMQGGTSVYLFFN